MSLIIKKINAPERPMRLVSMLTRRFAVRRLLVDLEHQVRV